MVPPWAEAKADAPKQKDKTAKDKTRARVVPEPLALPKRDAFTISS
jgi:hypothetical protein